MCRIIAYAVAVNPLSRSGAGVPYLPDRDNCALSGIFARPAIPSVIANGAATRMGSVRVRGRKDIAMVDPVVSSVLDDQRIVSDRWDDSDLPGAAAGSVDAGSMRFGDFSDHYMT